MVAFPRIVENLRTECFVYLLLICIYALSTRLLHNAINLLKLIVRPETVVKGECFVLAALWVEELRRWTLHLDATF